MKMSSIFSKESRNRRLENKWMKELPATLSFEGKVLDLGGVKDANYHEFLKIKSEDTIVWNFADSTQPDQVVDLDDVQALPELPSNCNTVLCINLLEHLFRPLELMDWICKSLPIGGQLIVVVPACYPIHPSPKDYWRILPDAFEKYFSDLKSRLGFSGTWAIEPIGEDFREATSFFTSYLFKGGKIERVFATGLETSASLFGSVAGVFLGKDRIEQWAKLHAPAIGVHWVKKS